MQRGALVVWACLLSVSCTANLQDASTEAAQVGRDGKAAAGTQIAGVESATEPQPIETALPELVAPDPMNEATPEVPPEMMVAPDTDPPPQALCGQTHW